MKNRQVLTTSRAAQIYEVMLGYRREYCADTHFFKMSDFWEWLCGGDGQWSIKTYRAIATEDYKPKAGVVAFGHNITLTADERLFENARRGDKLSNVILAHELSHLALNHHKGSFVTKHFQLSTGSTGMFSILPPTLEEQEADYAAVFFQCGVALMDPRLSPRDLANRAFSDETLIKNAQRFVRLEVFQRELNRLKPTFPRVIL